MRILYLFLFLLYSINSFAIIDSGDCGQYGKDVKWVVDDDYTLTFSGKGTLGYYPWSDQPWKVRGYGSKITKVVVEEGITRLTYSSFSKLENLRDVILSNTIVEVGDACFSGCKNLIKISLPKSVETIGSYAFFECVHMLDIEIPDNVVSIGERAFQRCSALKTVKFGRCITSIGALAFTEAENITKVVAPSLESWLNITFEDAASNPISITRSLFINNEKLTVLNIPEGVSKINNFAFYHCDNLKRINMSNSVSSIGKGCFSNCISLTDVQFSTNIEEIGESAFSSCGSLTEINIPNKCLRFGNYAFSATGINKITIPNNIKSIPVGIFSNCKKLNKCVIPESVENIREKAFFFCESLDKIVLPKSIKELGNTAFANCYSLEEIDIPESCSIIPMNCFLWCKSLKRIYIPSSCIAIYENAFANCLKLEEIHVLAQNTPTAYSTTFPSEIYRKCKLIVPDDNVNDYKNADIWEKFTNIISELVAINAEVAKGVEDKINAIGKVEYTDACMKNIIVARTAYDALSKDQQALVTNYSKLTDAEKKYDALKNNAEAAKVVEDKINAIGKVEYTDACKKNIDAARMAYDALTNDQQSLVKNLNILINAEQMYNKFAEDATGIDEFINAEDLKNGKFIVNGKLIIIKNNKKININGLPE